MDPRLILPIEASLLIPQQPPMRFVDRLVSHRDGEGDTEALVVEGNPMLGEDGWLEEVALLEYLAQACAASRGYEDALEGTPSARVGFLVGTRRFQVTGRARLGDRLVIRTRNEGVFGGFSMVAAEVRRDGEVLASATLKLWVAEKEPTA